MRVYWELLAVYLASNTFDICHYAFIYDYLHYIVAKSQSTPKISNNKKKNTRDAIIYSVKVLKLNGTSSLPLNSSC